MTSNGSTIEMARAAVEKAAQDLADDSGLLPWRPSMDSAVFYDKVGEVARVLDGRPLTIGDMAANLLPSDESRQAFSRYDEARTDVEMRLQRAAYLIGLQMRQHFAPALPAASDAAQSEPPAGALDDLRLLESVVGLTRSYDGADRAERLEDVLLHVEKTLARVRPQHMPSARQGERGLGSGPSGAQAVTILGEQLQDITEFAGTELLAPVEGLGAHEPAQGA